MRISRNFRTFLLGFMLIPASLAGPQMRPEDIDELMRSSHQQKIEYVKPDEDDENGQVLPENYTVFRS
ncbi:MAG TPA: hypothetical protein VGL89_17420 [Candidatus Koribacter sp.]|jgi:hypothetical protein